MTQAECLSGLWSLVLALLGISLRLVMASIDGEAVHVESDGICFWVGGLFAFLFLCFGQLGGIRGPRQGWGKGEVVLVVLVLFLSDA